MLLAALLAFSAGVLAAPAGTAQPSPQEEALQKRVEEFYGFLQVANWTRAESYLTEDSKEAFRAQTKKPFLGFRTESVRMDPGGTTASADVNLEFILPGFPGPPVHMSQTTHWRLINGTWYLELAQQPAPPSASAPNPGPEELKFEGHRYGLGKIQEGEVKVARFPFKNVADHVVTISDVVTGCPCLKGTLAKKQYKPGESGELAIAFDSAGYRLNFEETIIVKTEPGDRETYLLVYARVIPPPPPPPPAKPKPQSPKPPNP